MKSITLKNKLNFNPSFYIAEFKVDQTVRYFETTQNIRYL